MEPDTKENSKKARNMDRVNTHTQTEQFTKVSGKIVRLLASVNKTGHLARSTMVNGSITTWKASESTSMMTK